MPNDTPELPPVHPLIAALEKCGEPTVALRGILGTSEGTAIRLYHTLDASSYMEIPKDKLIYLEKMQDGEAGEVRAFVPASLEILEVQKRRMRSPEISSISVGPARPPGRWPPLEPAPTFWTCAGQCEGRFGAAATQILIDEAAALSDPRQQAERLAQIAQRKHEAKAALLFCLTQCVSKYGAPPFMAVPDDSPTGFHIDRFSLPRYHCILIAKHLEKPEEPC